MAIATPPRTPDPARSDDPEALMKEARRHRRQRLLRRAVLAAIVLVVAGFAFASLRDGSAHTPTAQTIVPSVAASIRRAGNSIVYEQTTQRRPVPLLIKYWLDLVGGRTLREQATTKGHLFLANSVSTGGDEVVFYRRHEWLIITAFRTTRIDSLTALGLGPNPLSDPRQHFTSVGEQTVDGHPTFHLRAIVPYPSSSPYGQVIDLWIDRVSYLPIRIQRSNRHGQVISTTDIAWLPRTQANLEKLDPVIPHGYPLVGVPPATPTAASPTAPLERGTDNGVSVTAGSNGVVVFDTTSANPAVKAVLATSPATFDCFTQPTLTDGANNALAGRIVLKLNNRVPPPYSGCEVGGGYGHNWRGMFAAHDPVEIAFNTTGRAYFADRAAARDLALFVRSAQVQRIRHLPSASAAAALTATYGNAISISPGVNPRLPSGRIRYTTTASGIDFSERSSTGKILTVDTIDGKITHQNLGRLAFVF